MANAIARISASLGYDAAESMLANGTSLASVLAFESTRFEAFPIEADCSPASIRDLTTPAPMLATVRPGKRAA